MRWCSGMRDPWSFQPGSRRDLGPLTLAINAQILIFRFFPSKTTISIHLPQIINLFNPTPHQFAGLCLPGGAQGEAAAPRPAQSAPQSCPAAWGEACSPPLTPSALSSALQGFSGHREGGQPADVFPFFLFAPLLPARCLLFLCRALRERPWRLLWVCLLN